MLNAQSKQSKPWLSVVSQTDIFSGMESRIRTQKEARPNTRLEDMSRSSMVNVDRKSPGPWSLLGSLLSPVATVERLGRDPLLLDEHFNQGLHGLHLFVGDKRVILGDRHEVHEAHVQDIVLVDVPEGVEPMGVVKMGVAAEHLFHNALAILVKGGRETTGLADPIICARLG